MASAQRQPALLLREVATVNGRPAVVFDRVLLPLKTEWLCYDVIPASAEDAARFVALLERLKV